MQDWLGVSELLSRPLVYDWRAGLPQERIIFRADSFVTLAAQARAGQGLARLPTVGAEGVERARGFEDAHGAQRIDLGILDRQQIREVASYVRTLSGQEPASNVDVAAGEQIFAENCVACHGP